MNRRALAPWGSTVIVLVALSAHFGTSTAFGAQRNDEAVREAGKHFQRGVTLYGETDYRGALVEFKRAYELSPNAAVLYNIGETEYQLRDYAGALVTFERYLLDSGPGDSHRAEVEANVRELKSRVGRLTITTVPRGAEVSVDDRALGKNFENPVVVGVGHLKVTASLTGRATVTQYIDVAAEDDVNVLLQLPPAASGKMVTAAPVPAAATSLAAEPAPPAARSKARLIGWITTAALGAGAVTTGVLALREGSKLKDARAAYGDNGTDPKYAAEKADELDRLSRRTRTYSILADSLGVAAVLVGAITLVSGFGSSGESSQAEVNVGYGSMSFRVRF